MKYKKIRNILSDKEEELLRNKIKRKVKKHYMCTCSVNAAEFGGSCEPNPPTSQVCYNTDFDACDCPQYGSGGLSCMP